MNSKKMNLKGLFAISIISLFSLNCIGQNIPQPVKDAFKAKFPTAKNVEWEKEAENEYEAEFNINEVEYSANFDAKGTWLETEMEIDWRDLPDAVLATLARDYWDTDVEEIAQITTAEETLYEIEIRIDEEEEDSEEYENEHEDDDDEEHYESMDLIFNASGTLVNKAELDDED